MRAVCLYFIVLSILSQGFTEQGPREDLCDDSEDDSEDECDNSIEDFVGTNLFGDDGSVKKCFSPEDVALLMARKDFENLIPKDMPKCLLDDQVIETLMQYFYGANQVILRMSNGDAKIFAQKAFYDTLGGYIKHYLIPVSKYSFYAGIVTLRTTLNILQLYNQCKLFLNTNGNGWSLPISDFSQFDLAIEPIKYLKSPSNEGVDQVACVNLNLADERSENDDEMIVALPKLEQEEYGLLSNIWLPFKRKHSFNLRSHSSAFILLRYYVMVSKCYTFQGVCQDTFNNKFKDWFQENVEVHLYDDMLYPGLGAVLRILESIRHRKKFVPVKANVRQSDLSSGIETSSAERKLSNKYLKLKNKANKYTEPGSQSSYMELGPHSAQSNTNVMDDFVTYEDEENSSVKARRKKYITIAVIISLFLLVFILAVAVITKYMSDKCEKEDGKKKGIICKKLKRRGRKADDEVELSKDSPSVVSSDKDGEKKKKETKSTKPADTKKSESPTKKKRTQPPPPQPSRRSSLQQKQEKPDRSSSSTSLSSSSPKKSRPSKTADSPKRKSGELKMDTIDEKGKSKRFSISKKSKSFDKSPPKEKTSPQRRGGSLDSPGVRSRGGRSSSWETIEQY